jgi:two-component system, NtrC family, nitrogen regulation response regulator NtrX
MPSGRDFADTILIVDDEESVRKTFREWLESANLGCRILSAADAEAALVQANQNRIDLAILDWNLGAGNDGLQLLEDLAVFNPDVVAIMITGYAHQATPLAAMRMGVRDYLDKNQGLDRNTFLTAVRRQLERIRPAKRARQMHQGLVAFRSAVEKVLPLVQAATALNDPVPLTTAVQNLFRFLLRTTGAKDGVLIVRGYDGNRQPPEVYRAYDMAGRLLDAPLVPFARSLAGSVATMQEPFVVNSPQAAATVELQPFEKNRRSLLAAPLNITSNLQAVLELFDKPGEGFGDADRRIAAAAADFGAEMLRQALAERQAHQVLFDAVGAALAAGDAMAQSLRPQEAPGPDEPPPATVLETLREGLGANPDAAVDADEAVRLAEAVRVLAVRHGPAAVRHCIRLVESLRALLDDLTSTGEARGE